MGTVDLIIRPAVDGPALQYRMWPWNYDGPGTTWNLFQFVNSNNTRFVAHKRGMMLITTMLFKFGKGPDSVVMKIAWMRRHA